jgi:cell wall-associated NlpC family hydrolase
MRVRAWLSVSVPYRSMMSGQTATQTVDATNAAAIAVDWALAQVGTPYIWGGETQGVGFDCSGLVQAAYRAAGITLPRVAQDQYDAGPQLPPDETLELGDLVFFGGGPTDVSHVGSTSEPKADKPSWSTPPTPAPTSESNHSPPPSEQASGVGT